MAFSKLWRQAFSGFTAIDDVALPPSTGNADFQTHPSTI